MKEEWKRKIEKRKALFIKKKIIRPLDPQVFKSIRHLSRIFEWVISFSSPINTNKLRELIWKSCFQYQNNGKLRALSTITHITENKSHCYYLFPVFLCSCYFLFVEILLSISFPRPSLLLTTSYKQYANVVLGKKSMSFPFPPTPGTGS